VEPNWLPYWLVDNIVTTIERVRKAGGTVLLEPQRNDLNSDIAATMGAPDMGGPDIDKGFDW
jgi:predicted enzyme related to lactoylglutathione lyase